MWLSSEYAYPNRFRYSRWSIPVESNRSMWRRWSGITSTRALALSISKCWPTRLMMKILSPIPNCSLLPRNWKDGWKPQDFLLPKTTTAGSSNIIHSHSQGNLFPSMNLKGSHTFTAQSAVVEDCEAEEDLGPKPNGEKEAKSSAEEDAGLLGKVGDIEPLLSYIMWFTNAVKLYQKKKCNCFQCSSQNHLVKGCPKELGKTARKVGLNMKEGWQRREAGPLRSWWLLASYPRWCSPSIKMPWKAPFLNPDPLTH